jgi:hypothetical protein
MVDEPHAAGMSAAGSEQEILIPSGKRSGRKVYAERHTRVERDL